MHSAVRQEGQRTRDKQDDQASELRRLLEGAEENMKQEGEPEEEVCEIVCLVEYFLEKSLRDST